MKKNRYIKVALWGLLSLGFIACNSNQGIKSRSLSVENTLDFPRREVLSISYEHLVDLLQNSPKEHFHIVSSKKEVLRTQWLDLDGNGIPEELLFLAEVPAKSKQDYRLVIDSTLTEPESNVMAYSRFVPERTDDYTWENDQVAFRTYGPTGQQEAIAGVPGSTLSSGIDLWLKRTDTSIINKWYSEHLKNPGYYHIDHGEGYDPYHVGGSRGTGGSGIWAHDSLYVSENYVSHKTLASGPLRTTFELTYNPWSPYQMKETKRISLDLGSHFSKFEIRATAIDSIPNYTVGISLHENQGKSYINTDTGCFSHWEIIDNAYVGEGIIVEPTHIDTAFTRKSTVVDQSNLLVLIKPQNTITYYAGFAWEKSGDVKTFSDWNTLMEKQVLILKNPLKIIYN